METLTVAVVLMALFLWKADETSVSEQVERTSDPVAAAPSAPVPTRDEPAGERMPVVPVCDAVPGVVPLRDLSGEPVEVNRHGL